VQQEPDLDPAMLRYYGRGREQARLRSCRLELIRTQELLRRFLPPPPAAILDVGGGAGAHALPLQEAGYRVALVDQVALHVQQALEAGVEHASVGDARALAAADASQDAVLLLGPLYHLTERSDRIAALTEARRVLRPDGRVFAAAISRFASTYDGLHAGFLADREFEAIVEHDLATGVHRNPDDRPHWFTTGYFHRPEELAAEVGEAGLSLEALLAIEGPGSTMADPSAWLDDPDRSEVLLRAIRRVEAEPALLGASSHLLAVAQP
jgi:SAM-dependent methyltransferase